MVEDLFDDLWRLAREAAQVEVAFVGVELGQGGLGDVGMDLGEHGVGVGLQALGAEDVADFGVWNSRNSGRAWLTRTDIYLKRIDEK